MNLQEMYDALKIRDDNEMEHYRHSSFYGTIEGKLAIADGRATDALVAVRQILRYLIEKEKQ